MQNIYIKGFKLRLDGFENDHCTDLLNWAGLSGLSGLHKIEMKLVDVILVIINPTYCVRFGSTLKCE